MRRKLKLAIFCMCLCWIVAFAQFAMTRFYLSHNDATQAFARNQLILENDTDSFQILSQEGGQIKGHLSGEMTSSERAACLPAFPRLGRGTQRYSPDFRLLCRLRLHFRNRFLQKNKRSENQLKSRHNL